MSLLSRRQAVAGLTLNGIGLLVAARSARGQSNGNKDNGNKDSKASEKSDDSDSTVYTPGGDVKPPKLIHYVEPRFSPSSKEAYVEGTVRISTVVDLAGLPTDLHVVEGLNTEEDGTAIEAVKQWRFQPGTRLGRAVHVKVTVQIDFHLL